tara:strand:- start:1711 stop:2571 length:861 start_codon:yes stop_codon:yes gene_type:complete
MKLNNKVALVSGSSMGIGKAIAIELASQGSRVILNGRDGHVLFAAEMELKALGYDVTACIADVRYPEQCQELIACAINTYGQLDILVNNAAVSSRGSVEKMATGNIQTLSDTNYTGAAYLSKYAIPHLRKTKGHLIFINSAGGFRGMPYNSAYSASKVAQAALADALRIELYNDGIHVGVTFVGFTENDPKKTILDVDGTWVYLPKRTNIKLAKPQTVAKSICHMIDTRTTVATLTNLGHLAGFTTRYLPRLSNWLLWFKRDQIKEQFTMIGGEKAVKNIPLRNLP